MNSPVSASAIKVALITGGGSGIGRASRVRIARARGYSVRDRGTPRG